MSKISELHKTFAYNFVQLALTRCCARCTLTFHHYLCIMIMKAVDTECRSWHDLHFNYCHGCKRAKRALQTSIQQNFGKHTKCACHYFHPIHHKSVNSEMIVKCDTVEILIDMYIYLKYHLIIPYCYLSRNNVTIQTRILDLFVCELCLFDIICE